MIQRPKGDGNKFIDGMKEFPISMKITIETEHSHSYGRIRWYSDN